MNFKKLENALNEMIEKYHAPGVDCIVYKNHEQIFRCFAGKSDIENNIPVSGNELYVIYSMTKMLTCTSALQLIEQGKLCLDDKLSDYLPEFENMKVLEEGADAVLKDAKNPILIKHLFTMSAGLDYNLGTEAIKEAINKGHKSTRDIVRAISKSALGFEPGTRYRYSLCHDVLGAVVEVVSGMKLSEYMTKNIFTPLGMKNTFFGVPKDEEKLSRLAKIYNIDQSGKLILQPFDCVYNVTDEYESGGAGLVSSTEDYSSFLDALACGGVGKNGNRIMNESTAILFGTNQVTGQVLDDFHNLRQGYGYGLGVRTHMEPEISGSKSPVGEFGWDGAAGGFSMVDQKNRLSLTYFQEAHGWSLEIQSVLRNALYESLAEE